MVEPTVVWVMIRTSILWVSVTDRRKWVLKTCGYKFTSDWKQLHDLHISKRFMQNRPRFTSWKLLSLWQTQSVSLVTVGMVGMVGKYYEIIQNRTEGWKRWLKLGPCNQGTERIESCDLPWRQHIWRSLDNILGRSQRLREQDFLHTKASKWNLEDCLAKNNSTLQQPSETVQLKNMKLPVAAYCNDAETTCLSTEAHHIESYI